MAAAFHLNRECLPAIVRAGPTWGRSIAHAARRWGLPAACRFIVGCLDQYAGAIGVGNVEAGGFSETTGTVLAMVQCADRFSTQLGPAVFQGPAFREGLYWRMTFSGVSANYLQWYRDQLPDRPDFERLLALAEAVEPGAAGLRLRTEAELTRPEEVSQGLTPRHGPGHAVRCILETVAAALAEQMASLAPGNRPESIRCAGGGAARAICGCKSRPIGWGCPRRPRRVRSPPAWAPRRGRGGTRGAGSPRCRRPMGPPGRCIGQSA